ncbi:unnamed protein product [Adineta steineri]|uniref:Uncharacterized protein n=1 Tax=Adineta steineri TaxID=433720 RepID=A0A816D2K1_9BILA|nr:unnamed protein product [Adineta steineri]CAF1627728.1 unnamed protein product [Adineta steineri]
MGLNLGQTDNNVCINSNYNWHELSQSLIDEYYAIHNGVCKKYEERLVVIYDFNIKELKTNFYNSIMQLEPIVDGINIFTNIDRCVEFLMKNEHAKIFLIIRGPISDSIMSRIHHISQVNSIYILLQHESYDDQSIKNWLKVTGIYTEISVICNALKRTIQECNQDSIAISFSLSHEILDQSFSYIYLFKKNVFNNIDDRSYEQVNELTKYYREKYPYNHVMLKVLERFAQEYDQQKAIWWFTYACCLDPLLTQALRTLDTDTIDKVKFFLIDIHQQIEKLYREQSVDHHDSFIVYHSQGLTDQDFEKLKQSKHGLISFNNFLLTSQNYELSFEIAHKISQKSDLIGILFVMSINPIRSTIPFARLNNEIAFGSYEEEILFSMQTSFRIIGIQPMEENN